MSSSLKSWLLFHWVERVTWRLRICSTNDLSLNFDGFIIIPFCGGIMCMNWLWESDLWCSNVDLRFSLSSTQLKIRKTFINGGFCFWAILLNLNLAIFPLVKRFFDKGWYQHECLSWWGSFMCFLCQHVINKGNQLARIILWKRFRLFIYNIIPKCYQIIALKWWFQLSQMIQCASNGPDIDLVIIRLLFNYFRRKV